ncbi:MAG: DUF2231 domain-containing protein [Bacteroidia bacterium]
MHPLIVHFPIALLFFSGALYAFALVKNHANFLQFASLSHLVGTISIIAAIISGQQAEAQTIHTHDIHAIIERHGLLSWVCIWAFALLYVWQLLRIKKNIAWEKYLFLAVFMGMLGLIGYSAHLGGQMVYEKGAGVTPYKPQLEQIFQTEQAEKK